LSTLTKVLIILLTLSSIFLCGIVVTYVANADNYKQKYEGERNTIQSLTKKQLAAESELNKMSGEFQRQEKERADKIAALNTDIQGLKNDLEKAKIDRDDAQRKMNSWESQVMSFSQTTTQQVQLAQDAMTELNTIKDEQIQDKKELEETTTSLIDKMAIIAQLQDQLKRLTEEKTDLQSRFDQQLRKSGKEAVTAAPITQPKETAQVAPGTREIGLKGLVKAVNTTDSYVELSIGSADGVKKDMIFHITRGEKFICDISIFSVDLDKSVGLIGLTIEPPRPGDTASTNL
jgi:chromosome segregation ATPase